MRHLVVVIPGIGGSVLADGARVVWDAGIGDITGLVLRPDRLDLGSVPKLTPKGLIRSRTWLPGWTVVHGYQGLMASLASLPGAVVDSGDPGGRVPGATVVAFPYDFRRSIAEAAERLQAEVDKRLEDLGGERDKRVIVVAHSMGGLVARHWLGPGGGWPLCRALITLGTPHRGAPKALQLLVNGFRKGPFSAGGLTEMIEGWPSAYELLPRYEVVWDEAAGRSRYPHELPIRRFAVKAKVAFETHQSIEEAWEAVPRSGPEVIPVLGWSHPTLQSALWDGRLRVGKAAPQWIEAPGWEKDLGDGTVPALSAAPLEMSDAQRGIVRLRERHGPIAAAPDIVDLIGDYESRGTTRAARGEETPAALGLDLEDCYDTGEEILVTVTVRHAEPTAETKVWATVRTAGRRDKTQVELRPVPGGSYAAAVTAPGQGLHELEVMATGVAGAGDLRVVDSFCTVGEA
ncbi:MAG: esterase/lipase family protein [Streptosporangiaceae bacterium]